MSAPPIAEQWRIATHGATEARGRLATHPEVSTRVLEAVLASDPSAGVRARVARRGVLPTLLAQDPHPAVRLACARSALPHDVAARLALDPSVTVRKFLAENRALDPDTVALLATDPHPGVRCRAARHPGMPPERVLAVRAAAMHPWLDNDGSSARSFPFTADEQRWLASSLKWGRCLVARSLHTTPEILASLSTDPLATVRAVVAANPATPDDALSPLLADPDGAVRTAAARRRPDAALATDPDARVRAVIALHIADPDVVAMLLQDPEPAVRQAAFDNPALPMPALLGALGSLSLRQARRRLDEAGWRRALDAGYVHDAAWYAPRPVARALHGHPDFRVRQGLAVRGEAEDLVRLADDPAPFVRSAVADNAAAPSQVLARLAADPDPNVRYSAARNPHTFGRDLERLADDPVATVRRAVAENDATPVGLLIELARDSADPVRRAAAGNHRTPAEIRDGVRVPAYPRREWPVHPDTPILEAVRAERARRG